MCLFKRIFVNGLTINEVKVLLDQSGLKLEDIMAKASSNVNTLVESASNLLASAQKTANDAEEEYAAAIEEADKKKGRAWAKSQREINKSMEQEKQAAVIKNILAKYSAPAAEEKPKE